MIVHPALHCQIVTFATRQKNTEHDNRIRDQFKGCSATMFCLQQHDNITTNSWPYFKTLFQYVDRLRKVTIHFETQIQKDSRQSTTMFGQPRFAAVMAVCGHTVARLLIKQSPMDMVITGAARNVPLPGDVRPTRLPTARGDRPNQRDRPRLQQHNYVLNTWV